MNEIQVDGVTTQGKSPDFGKKVNEAYDLQQELIKEYDDARQNILKKIGGKLLSIATAGRRRGVPTAESEIGVDFKPILGSEPKAGMPPRAIEPNQPPIPGRLGK